MVCMLLSFLFLFYFGAARSFVSLALRKKLDVAPGELDCHLEVEIFDDHRVSALGVHRDCVVDMLRKRYPFDLVHIPERDEDYYWYELDEMVWSYD